MPCLKCTNCILRAFVFLASVQASLKKAEDGNHAIFRLTFVQYIITVLVENSTIRNTLLTLFCIFKHVQFQNCNDDYFMYLIYACSFIYNLIHILAHDKINVAFQFLAGEAFFKSSSILLRTASLLPLFAGQPLNWADSVDRFCHQMCRKRMNKGGLQLKMCFD